MGCNSSTAASVGNAIDGSVAGKCPNCGKSFQLSLLKGHIQEGTCIKQIIQDTEYLPQSLRGAKPALSSLNIPTEESTAEEIAEYNKKVEEGLANFAPTCYCGKKIAPADFQAHAETCEEYKLNSGATKIQTLFKGVKDKKQYKRLVVCYMCGDTITLERLANHQLPENCPAQNDQLRAELESRQECKLGPKPKPPAGVTLPTVETTSSALNDYNKKAQEAYRASLCTCNVCNTKYDLDRMAAHIASKHPKV